MTVALATHSVLADLEANMTTEQPVVRIAEGLLRGEKLESVRGVSYYSFKGIPYAKPPVGDLRFKVSK